MLSLLTEAPHLICLTEQHLNNDETDVTPICNYKLGAKCCRKKLKTGAVCIYIEEALKFTNIILVLPRTILPLTYFIHLPMKMEPIVSSETSAIRIQTPGNYPKRNKLQSQTLVCKNTVRNRILKLLLFN